MINIPICRAKKIDSDEYIEGYLMGVVQEDNLCSIREQNADYIGGDICILTTLAIHFPNMLDIQGNKIFASLSEDGKGGDIVKIKTSISNCEAFYYFDNEAMSIRLFEMSKSHMTWEYGITLDYDGNPTKKVIGIQE